MNPTEGGGFRYAQKFYNGKKWVDKNFAKNRRKRSYFFYIENNLVGGKLFRKNLERDILGSKNFGRKIIRAR